MTIVNIWREKVKVMCKDVRLPKYGGCLALNGTTSHQKIGKRHLEFVKRVNNTQLRKRQENLHFFDIYKHFFFWLMCHTQTLDGNQTVTVNEWNSFFWKDSLQKDFGLFGSVSIIHIHRWECFALFSQLRKSMESRGLRSLFSKTRILLWKELEE